MACHADVTAAQCVERRSMRIKAKKKLKAIMSDHRNAENIEKNASCGKVYGGMGEECTVFATVHFYIIRWSYQEKKFVRWL